MIFKLHFYDFKNTFIKIGIFSKINDTINNFRVINLVRINLKRF